MKVNKLIKYQELNYLRDNFLITLNGNKKNKNEGRADIMN